MVLKRAIKWALERAGLAVVTTQTAEMFSAASWRYGVDYLRDIERLDHAWDHPISTFFDVGANCGQTALAASRRFPSAQVISFEPHPDTFDVLTRNVRRLRNVRAVNVAVGATTGFCEMFSYSNSELNSLLSNSPTKSRLGLRGDRLSVKCTTLDSFCEESGVKEIGVLKIDTEGFELAVLQGASRMLREGRIRFVYAEFNDLRSTNDTTAGALMPLDDLLRRHRYRFISSYTDHIETSGQFFLVSNALFALT